MEILAFTLAAIALIGGIVLWALDRRQRSSREPQQVEAGRSERDLYQGHQESVEYTKPGDERDHELGSEDPYGFLDQEDTEGDGDRPGRSERAERAEHKGMSFPGAGRRERRAWAQERDFSFAKSDDYLNDEWHRGAAAGGEPARDVVSGVIGDREFYLLDLGNVPVMATRRPGESDVVVDFRRPGLAEESSDDLHLVNEEVPGFDMYASDEGAARRFFDVRVATALEALPESVQAVWLEGGWVLAQLERGSHAEEWDATTAPLTLIADAAPVLPPRADTPDSVLRLRIDDLDPSRALPPKHPQRDESGNEIPQEDPRPPVNRPEEPLDMPSRVEGISHGVVEPRSLGGDEVDAIGDEAKEPDDYEGTRILRDLRGSSIFDDLASELGQDPLEGIGEGAEDPDQLKEEEDK